MPNGDYTTSKEEWDRIRRFFESKSAILNQFANHYNLLIDKYYHHNHRWDFRFAHPSGGDASVGINRVSNKEVVIDYSWSIDVYEEFTRYIKWSEFQRIQANDDKILLALRKSLKQCINSNKTEMGASPGYENLWGKMTKSEWEKIYLNNYPHPKNLKDL